MSYDLTIRRRVFQIGLVVFVGLMVAAWVMRPLSLSDQIRQAGIELVKTGYNPDSKLGFYTVSRPDSKKLRQWLYDSGFKGDTLDGQDDFSFGFRRARKIFLFISSDEMVTLGDYSQIDKSAPIKFTIIGDK